MVDDSGTQDGTYRATSFPFDPLLGARLLGEIQAEGLRAAGDLVDRLVHLVDGPRTATDADPEAGPDAAAPPTGPAGVDLGAVLPWFDLWRDLVERTSETVQRLRVPDGADGEVRVDVDGGAAPLLSIALGPDGRGQSELWLHNGTTTDRGELVLACGPLTDVEGTALVCDVEFDPPKIADLPSRSSRGITVTVGPKAGSPTPAANPGTYRGIVQVRGAEDVWLPLELVVPGTGS